MIVLGCLLPASLLAAGPMVITEIAASEPSGHEWIKVLNVGTDPINLTAWKFVEDETNHGIKEFRGGPLVPPGSSATVAQDADSTAADYSEDAGLLFDSAWGSLNESGEIIGLRDASGTLAESFTYPEAKEGVLVRKDPSAAADNPANWGPRIAPQGASATSTIEEGSAITREITASSSIVRIYEKIQNDPVIVRVPVYEEKLVPITKTVVKTIKVQDTTIVVVEVPHIYERIVTYLPQETNESALKEKPTVAKMKASAISKTKTAKMVSSSKKKTKNAGPLMTIEGIVLEHASRNLIVEKGGDEIFVQLPTKASKRATRVTDGDRVRVTGIGKEESDGSWSMKMRGPRDLVVLERTSSTAKIAPTEELKTDARKPHPAPAWPYLGVAGIGSALLAGHLARQHRKQKLHTS